MLVIPLKGVYDLGLGLKDQWIRSSDGVGVWGAIKQEHRALLTREPYRGGDENRVLRGDNLGIQRGKGDHPVIPHAWNPFLTRTFYLFNVRMCIQTITV